MRRLPSTEAGFSLVETLVTVVIIGITFVVFVGGMGTSFFVSDRHQKQAVAHASIRNFAEAVKAAPFSTDCSNLAATYTAAFSPPPPTRRNSAGTADNATSHTAPSVTTTSSNTMLLAFYAIAVGTNATPPEGMTPGWQLNSNSSTSTSSRVSVLFADQPIAAKTPTGPRAATSANPADSVAQLVSLTRATGVTEPPRRRGVHSVATPVGSAGSLTLRAPADTATGDAMIAQVAVRGSTAVAPPPGWTLINAKTHNSVTSLLYERSATVDGAVDFAWTFNTVTEAAGGIVSYGGASRSGYQASVTAVQVWNATATPPGWGACDPDFPENNDTQLVSLRLASSDESAIRTIDVVKRCHQKPHQAGVCEDSP